MKIKNIEKAAQRIIDAVDKNEQIMIFGDSDMDGVSSVVILEETINNLISLRKKKNYPEIVVAFPDRDKEGYGLNPEALKYLLKHKQEKSLLITLDCGITNFDEVKEAKKQGFEVIICDHHKVLDKVPEADIIVAPKQKGDKTTFKDYCNAGLAFKLSKEILKDKMSLYLEDNFIELVMLATIADMMPEEEENQEWIIRGLANLQRTQRPAIQAFYEVLDGDVINSKRAFVGKIISVFNTVKMKDHKIKTYFFINSNNLEDARRSAKQLLKDAEDRQREIRALTNNLKEYLKENPSSIIFEGSKDYRADYLGAVASRLVSYFGKPVFLYAKKEDISRGTVRVPKGIDAVKAMDSCKNLLLMYGGHPPAAGFTVQNENIEDFKKCLIKYFN
jgi:single-stranded-DNA-specific exonuclease